MTLIQSNINGTFTKHLLLKCNCSKMEFFALDSKFDSFKALTAKKKEYEVATNNLLVISDAHKVKGDGPFKEKFVDERLTLSCKAGEERPTESKGLRESKTYKKNCPVKVRKKCPHEIITVLVLNIKIFNLRSDSC